MQLSLQRCHLSDPKHYGIQAAIRTCALKPVYDFLSLCGNEDPCILNDYMKCRTICVHNVSTQHHFCSVADAQSIRSWPCPES